MPPRSLKLQAFLDRYKKVLQSIAALADSAHVDTTTIIAALIARPFSLPAGLQHAEGSDAISDELRRLRQGGAD